MGNNIVRLTMAQAIVRYLVNQYTEIDGVRVPLFAGAFGIFGHGNVTCLAEALERVQDQIHLIHDQHARAKQLQHTRELSRVPLHLQQTRLTSRRG